MSPQRPLWLTLAPALFLVLWAGGYVVAKIGLQFTSPMMLLSMRFACVVAIMAVMFIVIRPPLPKTKADWGHLAFVGFLVQTVYFGIAYLAFANGVAAGTAAVIMALQPILVALIAPRWNGEQVSWRQWGGLIIALAGAIAVIMSRLEIGPPPLLGFLYALIALFGITFATLWEKRFGLSHHPVTANLIGYAAGLIGLLPLLLLQGIEPVNWTWTFAAAFAYLVMGNSVIAVGLLLAMIRVGEVSKVSAMLFLVPPLTALMAWFILGEIMPPVAWAGIAVAGLGVWLATRK
jgi:drug/metabolite transporter (DMT)-like permease